MQNLHAPCLVHMHTQGMVVAAAIVTGMFTEMHKGISSLEQPLPPTPESYSHLLGFYQGEVLGGCGLGRQMEPMSFFSTSRMWAT